MTATANIRTALTATQPRPPVPPTSSRNRFTRCACRRPACLPGQHEDGTGTAAEAELLGHWLAAEIISAWAKQAE